MNTLLTLLSEENLRSFAAAGHWRDRTIYGLVRDHARRGPDKIAVRERDRSTTYGDLIEAVDRLASALAARGLRSGDRVAVWLPSRTETVVAVLACSRSGYVACPSLHRDHTVAEIAELVKRMRASALLVQRGYGADAEGEEIVAEVEDLEHLRMIRVLDPVPAGGLFPDLPAGAPGTERTDPNTVSYLAFTSGTTGQPKGSCTRTTRCCRRPGRWPPTGR
ncbi:class I adenylate-forming enzyme family protein [Blastococcus brunescens]|uniref:Class I adenylate-forming enzyme family protein n=2 Tax=Blastococcus brunescens TaxID=1564165 RepID=A0ABZ1B8V0_9ACTN|nr:class I adenylate-forming enzyme family protein [Blastococcus sp. BMG 8361]WRL67220.1 class I adenylate-forming enzyme family protein [Blastococcus sp. BMG 8361]